MYIYLYVYVYVIYIYIYLYIYIYIYYIYRILCWRSQTLLEPVERPPFHRSGSERYLWFFWRQCVGSPGGNRAQFDLINVPGGEGQVLGHDDQRGGGPIYRFYFTNFLY